MDDSRNDNLHIGAINAVEMEQAVVHHALKAVVDKASVDNDADKDTDRVQGDRELDIRLALEHSHFERMAVDLVVHFEFPNVEQTDPMVCED